MTLRKWLPLVIGVGVGVVLFAMRISPQSALVAQAFYFVVTPLVIIPIHELGHAVAGSLVGFRIVSISLGSGPPLFALQLLGVKVRIHVVPFMGMTLGLPKLEYQSLRWRRWIFTAGGPAANVLIYFALRRIFGPAVHDFKHHPFVWTAAWANWSLLAMNLFPFHMKNGLSSDGHWLFTIPFWSKQKIAEEHARSAAARASHAIVEGDLDTAERLAHEVRLRYPEGPSTLLMLGSLEHARLRHEAARELYRQALAKLTEPRVVALAKNNIAFMSVMLAREDDLPEADRLSGEALAVLTDVPAIAGTRGAVLLRLGRVGEAWPLLLASEAGAEAPRHQAYAKALVACALALRGQPDEARRKLAEARQADPGCDLLPRAEADIAAAATAPPPVVAPSPGTDVANRAIAFRRWQGHTRVVAFGSLILMSNRFGSVFPALIAVLVALSFTPELSGVLALATCAAWTGVLFAFGFIHHHGATDPTPAGAAPAALGIALAGCWLAVRHRRIGPPQPSRVPTALGWVLAGLGIFFTLPPLLGLQMSHSRFAVAGAARDFVVPSLLLVALVPIVATRRAPAVRALGVLPAAVAALTLIGASDWYLDRVALAGTHPDGASIAWSPPVPARVLRSRTIAMSGRDATLSPGGTAFFVRHGGWLGEDSGLAAADFETRLVDVPGTTGAFLDDDRLLVFREGDAKTNPVLAEVRFSAGPKPVWTKPFPVKRVYPAGIEIDPETGRVYVLVRHPETDEAVAFQTVADAATAIEPIVAPRAEDDQLLAHSFSAGRWEGIFVVRGSRNAADVWWRTATDARRLGAAIPDLDCPRGPLGDRTLWCLTRDVPILFKVDGKEGSVSRVPGELPYAWSQSILGQSRLAVLGRDEIGIIDLDARHGSRLTLPETDDRAPSRLARGGLATLASSRNGGTTLVVYAEPASP